MSKAPLKPIDQMTPEEEAAWIAEMTSDNESAAREHLAAGRAISYREDSTPPRHVIREYPDGHRELIFIDTDGKEHVVRPLAAE
jgi:hypothetical protein